MDLPLQTCLPNPGGIIGFIPPTVQVTIEMLIEFEQDSFYVNPRYHNGLIKIATLLSENQSRSATITDLSVSLSMTNASAQEDFQQRAQNLMNYLVDTQDIQGYQVKTERFFQFIDSRYPHQPEMFRMSVVMTY